MIIGWMDERNIRMPAASECQSHDWRCNTNAGHNYSDLNHKYTVGTQQTEEMSVYQAPDRKCSVVSNLHAYNLTYDTCRRVFLAKELATQLVKKIPRILQNPKAY